MCADDVKVCFLYNNIESGFCWQSDINIFQECCQYNLLNLNYLKCNVMTYYRGTPTFLYIVLDPILKFDSHIISTVNKAMISSAH